MKIGFRKACLGPLWWAVALLLAQVGEPVVAATPDSNTLSRVSAQGKERLHALDSMCPEEILAVLQAPSSQDVPLSRVLPDSRHTLTPASLREGYDWLLVNMGKGGDINYEGLADFHVKVSAAQQLAVLKPKYLLRWFNSQKEIADPSYLEAFVFYMCQSLISSGLDEEDRATLRNMLTARNTVCRILSISLMGKWCAREETEPVLRTALKDYNEWARLCAISYMKSTDKIDAETRRQLATEFIGWASNTNSIHDGYVEDDLQEARKVSMPDPDLVVPRK